MEETHIRQTIGVEDNPPSHQDSEIRYATSSNNFLKWTLFVPCSKIFSRKGRAYWILLFLSSLAMMTAFPASSILSRLYYVSGGKSRWLLAWIAAAGWPITLAFLLLIYWTQGISPTPLTLKSLAAYAIIGLLSAGDNLMFAWSYAYLPASTSSLLSSSSLTFTALFAYFIVGKNLTAFTFNAIGIMTAGAVLIGLDSNADKPSGVNSQQYILGFILDILASALHGLIFALSELAIVKLLGRKSFHVVLELQVMTSFFACVFTLFGLVFDHDFHTLKLESRAFNHGTLAYYMVLIWAAISFQLGVLGSVGILYLTSTLFAGFLNAARVPVTAIVAVLCFHDHMGGFKILALLLTLWSFGSYTYGAFLEVQESTKSIPMQASNEQTQISK